MQRPRPARRRGTSQPAFLHLLLLVLLLPSPIQAAVRDVELNVTHGFRALDGVDRLVILVNGQTPGPVIRARKGDRLRVRVHNQLSDEEGLSLHFHGMWNVGAPFADGTSLAQCPIPPGESFVYDFAVGDQVGTYFYHGHLDTLQMSDGLYGPLVVEDPDAPFAYDEERIIMLGDWWHQDGRSLTAGLVQQPFRWMGDPQSLLVNGKGNYTACATAPRCTPPTPAQALEQVLVAPGKTYLLRVVGATSLSFLDLAVEGHTLTVVEADGHYVAPYDVTHLHVNSGERYGVLLRTHQTTPSQQQQQSYWISVETRFRQLLKGYAVLQYASTSTQEAELALPPTDAAAFVHPGTWDARILDLQKEYMTMMAEGAPAEAWEPVRDQVYRLEAQAAIDWADGLKALARPPPQPPAVPVLPAGNATHRLRLVQHQCRASRDRAAVYTPYDEATETYLTRNNGNGYLRWCMNNQTNRAAVTPVLLDLLAGGRREHTSGDDASADPMVVPLQRAETVDILLVNGRALNNVSEQHPFHLHGHAFWVLGHGVGDFDPAAINRVDPPMRDMITLFPFGWALLRFTAGGNPGVWPFHCHIQPHALMGMNVVFLEDIPRLAGSLPPDGFGLCGRLSTFAAAEPAMAALFLRGGIGGQQSTRAAIVPLSVLLVLSLLVNLAFLLRASRTRAWVDVATRRVLGLSSPRRQEGGEQASEEEQDGGIGSHQRARQPLPTESPVVAFGGRGPEKEGGGIEPRRSPVGS